jgi:hypothetical protein
VAGSMTKTEPRAESAANQTQLGVKLIWTAWKFESVTITDQVTPKSVDFQIGFVTPSPAVA